MLIDLVSIDYDEKEDAFEMVMGFYNDDNELIFTITQLIPYDDIKKSPNYKELKEVFEAIVKESKKRRA